MTPHLPHPALPASLLALCRLRHLQDSTNPSKEQELMYGHRSGGFFGYRRVPKGTVGGGGRRWTAVGLKAVGATHVSEDTGQSIGVAASPRPTAAPRLPIHAAT